MILTCPSCETQYFADDSTIGEGGRTVKCAACGHNWFVNPDGGSGAQPAEGSKGAHEIYKERVREQRRRKSRFASLMSWLVTAAIFFALGLASMIFRNDVVKLWPQAASAYKILGFEVNRYGLEFEDIQRSRTFNDTIPVVTVTGRAVNVARSETVSPYVRVELRDETGTKVADAMSDIRPSKLQPGQSGEFEVIIERAPMESFEIVLSFVEASDAPQIQPAAPPPTQNGEEGVPADEDEAGRSSSETNPQ